MARRKSKGGKTNDSTTSAVPEVEAVAIILMNAVVAAIDEFESDHSFLVGMGSMEEDEGPEGGMEDAAGLKKSLTQYLGKIIPMSWEPQIDDLRVLTRLVADFGDRGLLRIEGHKKGPDVYVGWASDFAWSDGTSDELGKFEAVCNRVLAGCPVASSLEELEEVASVLAVDVKMGSDGKWFASSGEHTKSANSVLEAATVILTDRAFWSRTKPIANPSDTSPEVPKAPIAVQDPEIPAVFHEDGRAFRYEKGYRVYL
jgi:hypothetical protein